MVLGKIQISYSTGCLTMAKNIGFVLIGLIVGLGSLFTPDMSGKLAILFVGLLCYSIGLTHGVKISDES